MYTYSYQEKFNLSGIRSYFPDNRCKVGSNLLRKSFFSENIVFYFSGFLNSVEKNNRPNISEQVA